MPKTQSVRSLRRELESRMQDGQCVYCKAPAEPDRPLTREHVIPRAKGGRRRDHRIIVPACARCNHTRGCQEIVLFLLARPRRITAFLDYLATLPPETISQMDPRVFAELYAAVWLFDESVAHGPEWREHLREMCSGRRLHRRRYAARRLVDAVGDRLQRMRARGAMAGPSCLLPTPPAGEPLADPDVPTGNLRAGLITILSLLWAVPAEQVLGELMRETGRAADPEPDVPHTVPRARRSRRVRVDRRGTRGVTRGMR